MFMQILSSAPQTLIQTEKTPQISLHAEAPKKRWVNQEASGAEQQRADSISPPTLRGQKAWVAAADVWYSHLWLRRLPLYMLVTPGRSQVKLSPPGRSFSLCLSVDGALLPPAPASQPRRSGPYHLSNYSRGNFPPQPLRAGSQHWSAGSIGNPPPPRFSCLCVDEVTG